MTEPNQDQESIVRHENEQQEYLDALVDSGYFDADNGGDIWYECLRCRSNLVGSPYAICSECGDE